jgi:hypothetical protein
MLVTSFHRRIVSLPIKFQDEISGLYQDAMYQPSRMTDNLIREAV